MYLSSPPCVCCTFPIHRINFHLFIVFACLVRSTNLAAPDYVT